MVGFVSSFLITVLNNQARRKHFKSGPAWCMLTECGPTIAARKQSSSIQLVFNNLSQ